MRFLLDTNILIPLEDSQLPLKASLANFVRLSHANGHELIYHPASENDINRDSNELRKQQTLERLRQYSRLENCPDCPWNDNNTTPNDAADNEILYAIYCDAAHALITEDHGIHQKAKLKGISDKVYYIQTADDWLRRLYERVSVQLPNIEEIGLHSLVPVLNSNFFDSLRDGYPNFDDWFRSKARNGMKAWVVWDTPGVLGAICIYDIQTNEKITEEGLVLNGAALKLSTFKVGETMRGRKIGELFLKAAFRFATLNHHENIFIHGELDEHSFLFDLLEDFGFENVGTHPGSTGRDVVYVKHHPTNPPPASNIKPFDYFRKYYPHYHKDSHVKKFLIPIQPEFHRILFPDYTSEHDKQLTLFQTTNNVGNAIKLAYLCHAQMKSINAGDIVFFYRSDDEQSITSIGIVEQYQILNDPSAIAQLVSRRTVYTMKDIENMAQTDTRVMLFRLVKHFKSPVPYNWLLENKVIKGRIQSIQSINQQAFESVIQHAGV
ncbi:MAG: EVE domain-containing protein [Methylophilus sp.]|nr:EVE domain-containing protein [Methylophilus sp.]